MYEAQWEKKGCRGSLLALNPASPVEWSWRSRSGTQWLCALPIRLEIHPLRFAAWRKGGEGGDWLDRDIAIMCFRVAHAEL